MKDRIDWTRLAPGAFLALALLLVFTFTARADDYACTGSVGGIKVDNLYVPAGETCTLDKTRVEGNLFVESNATLHAYAVRVDGNIQTDSGAARVNVYSGSSVLGSIQIVSSGAAVIQDVKIYGDLFFDDNDLSLSADGNKIDGNLQAFQNTGGVSITGNKIDGDLQCKENDPAPTGGDNVVDGSMEDQCADLEGAANAPPVAESLTVSTGGAQPIEITLQAADGDGDALTYTIVDGPLHGSLDTSGLPTVIYTPDAGFSGTDEFTFRASDGQADSNTATVSITVESSNTPPGAVPQAAVTDEDTPVTITLIGIDADGDPLTYSYNQPANGTVTGAGPDVVYTPDLNYYGADSFTFRVNDGTVSSAPAQVVLTILPVNDPPDAADDVGYSVPAGQTLAVTAADGVLSNDSDPEGDAFFVREITRPPAGEAAAAFSWEADGSFVFTPVDGFAGEVDFTYTAEDGQGAVSEEATVTILVYDADNPLIEWVHPAEYIPAEQNYFIARHDTTLTLEVRAMDNVEVTRVVFKKQSGSEFVEIGTVTSAVTTDADGWSYYTLAVDAGSLGSGFVYLSAEAYDDVERRSPQKLVLVRVDQALFMPVVAR